MKTTSDKALEFYSFLINESGIRALSQINNNRHLTAWRNVLSIRGATCDGEVHIHITREMFDEVLHQTIAEILLEDAYMRSRSTSVQQWGTRTILSILDTKHRFERSLGSGSNVHASISTDLDGVPVRFATCTDVEDGEIWPVLPRKIAIEIEDCDVIRYARRHGFHLKRVPLLGPEEGPTELDGWALSIPMKGRTTRATRYFESLQDAYGCMTSIVSRRDGEE